MNVVRAVSSEGFGRIKYNTNIHRWLQNDVAFRNYFERETTDLPKFYLDQAKDDLGWLWKWLPNGALYHDPNAYLKEEELKSGKVAFAA